MKTIKDNVQEYNNVLENKENNAFLKNLVFNYFIIHTYIRKGLLCLYTDSTTS